MYTPIKFWSWLIAKFHAGIRISWSQNKIRPIVFLNLFSSCAILKSLKAPCIVENFRSYNCAINFAGSINCKKNNRKSRQVYVYIAFDIGTWHDKELHACKYIFYPLLITIALFSFHHKRIQTWRTHILTFQFFPGKFNTVHNQFLYARQIQGVLNTKTFGQ